MERISKLERIGRQLEPSLEQRLAVSEDAMSYINRFVDGLPKMPGYQTGKIERLKSLDVPRKGRPLGEILEILAKEVDRAGINSAGGTHMGYIPGGGLWTSAIADMLAAATNRYAGIAYSSPGAVEIENQIIRWLSAVVGYPAEAHGNLTSGGSIANLTAIKAARDFHQINSSNVKESVIYVTQQVHHCIHKALDTLGLREAVVRTVPQNLDFQMDAAALRMQLESDIDSGLSPFLVIATAGTTDTGAIDPLDKIADLCEHYQTWFHVDAAYGGFFLLVDEMKEQFKGLERSDSVVLDPHKTLFIPYGSGVVLLRDRNKLLASNSHKAAYMMDAYGMDDIDPADSGLELSKHFRGLRMWLPLQLHGLAPFKANLEEKLLLAKYFHGNVGKLGFETGNAPQLTVSIFRYAEGNNNRINKLLINALHEDGRVFFSSTMIEGKMWIRCAIVSHRTHMEEVNLALQMLEETLGKVLLEENFAHRAD